MTPPLEDIQKRLHNILRNQLSEPLGTDDLAPEIPLTQDGLALDSVSLLELVIGIENEFDILLGDGVLKLEHFASMDALARFIQSRLESGEAEPKPG